MLTGALFLLLLLLLLPLCLPPCQGWDPRPHLRVSLDFSLPMPYTALPVQATAQLACRPPGPAPRSSLLQQHPETDDCTELPSPAGAARQDVPDRLSATAAHAAAAAPSLAKAQARSQTETKSRSQLAAPPPVEDPHLARRLLRNRNPWCWNHLPHQRMGPVAARATPGT